MSLVFLYSVLRPCQVWAYCECAASMTGTEPHSQSLVREDGKGTEGKCWALERPQSWDYDLTPALLSWLLSANHLTLMSYTADSLSAK